MVKFNIPKMILVILQILRKKTRSWLTWLLKGTYLRHLRHDFWKYKAKMLLNPPRLGLNCSCRVYLPWKRNKWAGQDCPKGNNISKRGSIVWINISIGSIQQYSTRNTGHQVFTSAVCLIKLAVALDLGIIWHLKGFGWLTPNCQSDTGLNEVTSWEIYLTEPDEYSTDGSIGNPLSLIAAEILYTDNIAATAIQMLSCASHRPGHILPNSDNFKSLVYWPTQTLTFSQTRMQTEVGH